MGVDMEAGINRKSVGGYVCDGSVTFERECEDVWGREGGGEEGVT